MSHRLQVTCRPARESDTPDVMELTSTIWEGEDYVPRVWADWLADPNGQLVVAEREGRVLGLGKLTRLSEQDWWFEGLRVHPKFEGQGIASQINEYMVTLWLEIGSGTVRLATASFRRPVHHIAERSGFQKATEFSIFIAPALPVENEEFLPVLPDQIDEAWSCVRASPTLRLTSGLMDLGWQWAPPRRSFLAKAIHDGKTYWWRGKDGLLSVREDIEPGKDTVAMLHYFACPEELIVDYLLSFRRLAARLGLPKAALNAPLFPQMLSWLEDAGFQRDWEDSLYIYAMHHTQST